MFLLPCLLLCAVASGRFVHEPSRIKRVALGDTLENRSNNITSKVLIIGAGIAGIEAARLLQEHGIDTVVLEARNRTGGRISTIRASNGLVLDMGARYIHGLYGSIPSGLLTNPMWDLARAAGISICETGQHDLLGFYPPGATLLAIQSAYAEFMVFMREITRTSPSSNASVAYYANLFAQQQNFDENQHATFLNLVHFTLSDREGAELDAIGAKNYLDLTGMHYGSEPVVCDTGFATITDYLVRHVTNIHLSQVVTNISYGTDVVEVWTEDGQIYQAEYALVTLPLGVLKAKQVTFDPPLPQWKLDAIDRIGFGYYEKIILVWNGAWWNSTNFYFFRAANQSSEYRFWATANEWQGRASITCYMSGQAVSSLNSTESREQIVRQVRDILQELFTMLTIPPPLDVYTSDWNEDPFSRGSYAYISVKQMYDDPFRLSEPVSDRLLFAGEATSTDSYGYTHGALLTARREVTRLLFVYGLLPEPDKSLPSQSPSTTRFDRSILVALALMVHALLRCAKAEDATGTAR